MLVDCITAWSVVGDTDDGEDGEDGEDAEDAEVARARTSSDASI